MRPGQSFESREVAEHYKYRPPYPAALFEKLYELTEQHHSALDLGCGPGKIARKICERFDAVTAVDPSESMLSVAQALQSSRHANIDWVCSLAEEASFSSPPFDLIVAAASIHWMDHAVLFPRLLNHVRDNHIFAVVEGDDAYLPPWQEEWDAFLAKWIFELKGERYQPGNKDSAFARKMERHKDWLSLEGNASFELTFTQSVDEFVFCQYSRDTFAPSRLGTRMEEFSNDLQEVVGPHADGDGMLTYRVQSRVEWGRIRSLE